MKALVVGSGAREHALAYKLLQSPRINDVFVYPFRALPGIPAAELKDETSVLSWCDRLEIDFVVIGPEAEIADGLADKLTEQGIPCFAPTQSLARLESSKVFAKKLMNDAGIPTADYQVAKDCTDAEDIARKILTEQGVVVVKADGLASGKGVFVCQNQQDLDQAFQRLKSLPQHATQQLIIEQCLAGREVSFFCFVGQNQVTPLGFAVDFKRLKDGDLGPNTGGMGAYTPVPWLPENAEKQVLQTIVYPLLEEIKKQNLGDYTGVLYAGLMWSPQGPKVLEFNVRFGDPEAQVMAVASRSDWGELIIQHLGLDVFAVSEPSREDHDLAAVAVVCASSNYPYNDRPCEKRVVPEGLLCEHGDKAVVFLGRLGPDLRVQSGRVLTVVGYGSHLATARSHAYAHVEEIKEAWPEMQFRKDIALRAISES